MKLTLQMNGREVTLSEEELITIVKKHLESETTQRAKEQNKQKGGLYEIAPKPTEDKWFEVKPQSICQCLFKEKRADYRQEETRQLILEAFVEVENNPERYGRNFKTMMPKKTWYLKSVKDFEKKASQLGDRNADWVEQALEWAQRIANGETWEAICNNPDTANCYRLVKWKNGYGRLVGGSCVNGGYCPASDVYSDNYDFNSVDNLDVTVPLVVLYEE